MTPETITVDKALWERMVKFATDHANGARSETHHQWRHRMDLESAAIVAQLPTPVDPLVLRAREICARELHAVDHSCSASAIQAGSSDEAPMMRAVLAALCEKEAG